MTFKPGCLPWNKGRRRVRGPCRVDGCTRPIRNLKHHLCSPHYQRWRIRGSADAPRLRREKTGEPFAGVDGYLEVWDPIKKRKFMHHRVVWEKHHGPIPPNSDIHHLNGVRTDNRLCNLSLVPHSAHPRNLYVLVGSIILCPHCGHAVPITVRPRP